MPAAGRFAPSIEDFEVEELPAYQPSGQGEHLFLWVEKRGLSTPLVAEALARHCGVAPALVSWAGLKDARATTRQYLCLPSRLEAAAESFQHPGVRVLSRARHGNKLKAGHLAGNRFRCVVRQADVGQVEAGLEGLQRRGLPNFFGEQRFGQRGDNAQAGKRLLLEGGRMRDRFRRKLLLSAFQSALFNRVLELRLGQGTWDTPLPGDVLKKHESGGEFLCQDAAVDGPRARAFELSPTGPLFGPDMRQPAGEVQALERGVLEAEGLTLAHFDAGGGQTLGARRLLRVPLQEASLASAGDGVVELRFALPAGSYATVALARLLGGEDAPGASRPPR